ncbi:uncharacterized protein C17orf50-like [Lacerta agilis]|uniref:uncharacterized protein C17orf50-like n=1 Tax=Lacerta agilis TaxID=80427 RepID=UPI001419AB18|nr:uncharacterized protein C17orf50-like [Lacerta agilis]
MATRFDGFIFGAFWVILIANLPLPLRNKPLQEPVCSQLERNRSSGKMCPECEILFCKKCETLHYSRAFIEHGLLGHSTENLPEALSPALSAGSIELAVAPEESEEEIKRQ